MQSLTYPLGILQFHPLDRSLDNLNNHDLYRLHRRQALENLFAQYKDKHEIISKFIMM